MESGSRFWGKWHGFLTWAVGFFSSLDSSGYPSGSQTGPHQLTFDVSQTLDRLCAELQLQTRHRSLCTTVRAGLFGNHSENTDQQPVQQCLCSWGLWNEVCPELALALSLGISFLVCFCFLFACQSKKLHLNVDIQTGVAASHPSRWQQEVEMWLCWLPVLMDALTSVSQHCGERQRDLYKTLGWRLLSITS